MLPNYATSIKKKKNLLFPQSNETCLETFILRRLPIHIWQQTRGLGQSKALEQPKVLPAFY